MKNCVKNKLIEVLVELAKDGSKLMKTHNYINNSLIECFFYLSTG